MKKFIIIMIIVMIAFYGCDNGSNFYDREIVVSEDCTIGDRVGFGSLWYEWKYIFWNWSKR